MNMTIAEIEHDIKHNKTRIAEQAKRVLDYASDLQNMVESDSVEGFDFSYWTEGHVSADVTKLASLLQKQDALCRVLNIVKKGE